MRAAGTKNIITICLAALAAWWIALPAPGLAAAKNPQSPFDLDLHDVGKVAEIRKSDLIALENGKVYRLGQVRTPIQYEQVARNYLQETILGQTVGIYVDKGERKPSTDRYNNRLVHVLKEDGTWVQAALVTKGLAWVYTEPDNRLLAAPLYKYEQTAMRMHSGFWSNPAFSIKSKADIGNHINSFQIYQGTISSASQWGNQAFFEMDKENNTATLLVVIPMRVAQRLARSPNSSRHTFDPGEWQDAPIHIRGWIEKNEKGVPQMELTHTEQIQILAPH